MNICPNCFNSTYQNHYCLTCGYRETVARDDRTLPVGSVLHNRYYIGKILGIGGFGITYVTYDMKNRERLAVKEYFPAEWAVRGNNHCEIQPTSEEKRQVYQYGKDEFVNEAKILAGVKSIPNVVKVKNFFHENGTAYMVMELLEGATLSGYMRQNHLKRMPAQMAGHVLEVVGDTLAQLHVHMLLHRDISPDNIMITKGGRIKLIDFGSTRVYAMNSLQTMSVFIKPGFAPPEQYSRSGQGPWTDIYALASTYYYLVSGKKVPQAPERLMGAKLPYLYTLVPEISMETSKVINRALKISWRERPQTMRAFLEEYHRSISRAMPSSNGQGVRRVPYSAVNHGRASILSEINGVRERHFFPANGMIQIGRTAGKNQIVLNDGQVSRIHCQIIYIPQKRRFLVTNYSINKTYTSRGNIRNGEKIYLVRGDWIYIQTTKNRYLFYLEEE